MTASEDSPVADKDWLHLNKACRLADRERIAAWCRDGVVRSMAGMRVVRIRDLDTAINETIKEQEIALQPEDWNPDALGNLSRSHWENNQVAFDYPGNGLPFGFNLSVLGGTIYDIKVHRMDLESFLSLNKPKPQQGRPKGTGYAASDRSIVEKMRASLSNGDFGTPSEAAAHFAPEAKGGGTLASKAKRLVGRYNAPE